MSDNKRRLTYLSDIDGLRAIAVARRRFIPSKDPGLSGGYVGVDYLLCDIGFLISGSISDRVNTGANFQFLHSADTPPAPAVLQR